MTKHDDKCVTVSAPGKVLIAGGYLVLEKPNIGVVLAAKGCSFHVTITSFPGKSTTEEQHVSTSVNDATGDNTPTQSKETIRIPMDVHSPQFRTIFHYWIECQSNETNETIQILPREDEGQKNNTSNTFIEQTIIIALTFIQRHNAAHFLNVLSTLQSTRSTLAVKLRADNDFYSQVQYMEAHGLDLTPGNISSLPNFLPCPVDAQTGALVVNKTGMGSSAALVTSLVGALLRYFDVIPTLPSSDDDDDDDDDALTKSGIQIVHNLSQLCHSIAQGKVGSGFDVSSAVYGNHAYTRFDQALLAHAMMNNNNNCTTSSRQEAEEEEDTSNEEATSAAASSLYNVVTNIKAWDCTVQPLHLPRGLGMDLLMADVCGGSESPSMARKILKWKKESEDDDDDDLWEGLKGGNDDVWQCLQAIVQECNGNSMTAATTRAFGLQLSKMNVEQWRTIVNDKKSNNNNEHSLFAENEMSILSNILKLSDTLRSNRVKLKRMGGAAGNVPVEPDEQTKLADATMEVNGVVACGVPGAGGYDALFVLYIQGESTDDGKSDVVRDAIANLWRSHSGSEGSTSLKICPLSVRCAGEEWGGIRESALEW